MANFLKLVQNENMKIYRRVRTWIMLGFVVLIPILVSGITYLMAGPDDDLPSNWTMMSAEATILSILITIFTVVKSADSVAGEFSWGTIKLLLIRPWSRSSILLSKFVALLLFALLFAVISFILTFVVNAAMFGYDADAGSLPIGGTNNYDSPLTYMAMYYVLQFVSLVFVLSFGFMLSSAFRSGGLAIGLSIFLLLSGNIITGILMMTDKPWVKFLPFLYMDLTMFMNGEVDMLPSGPISLGFALAVLAGYFIVFNIVSWLVFTKRDVAG